MSNDLMTTIYIVRHGESEGNAGLNIDQNIPQDLGSPLTDTGKMQTKELAEKLRGVHIDHLFASPLSRAHETAQILADERKLAVEVRDRLRERVRGSLNGQDEKELRKTVSHVFGNPDVLSDEDMWKWRMFDDMETAEEAVSRFITEIREIAVAYSGKTIIVVTHGNIMRGFLVHLGEGTFKDFRTNTVSNTGYIKVETDGVDFFLKETYGIKKYEKGKEAQ